MDHLGARSLLGLDAPEILSYEVPGIHRPVNKVSVAAEGPIAFPGLDPDEEAPARLTAFLDFVLCRFGTAEFKKEEVEGFQNFLNNSEDCSIEELHANGLPSRVALNNRSLPVHFDEVNDRWAATVELDHFPLRGSDPKWELGVVNPEPVMDVDEGNVNDCNDGKGPRAAVVVEKGPARITKYTKEVVERFERETNASSGPSDETPLMWWLRFLQIDEGWVRTKTNVSVSRITIGLELLHEYSLVRKGTHPVFLLARSSSTNTHPIINHLTPGVRAETVAEQAVAVIQKAVMEANADLEKRQKEDGLLGHDECDQEEPVSYTHLTLPTTPYV